MTKDYDLTMAMDQMIEYLSSEQGRSIREALKLQLVSLADDFGDESVEFLRQVPIGELMLSQMINGSSNPLDGLLQTLEKNSEDNHRGAIIGQQQQVTRVLRIVRKSNGLSSEVTNQPSIHNYS